VSHPRVDINEGNLWWTFMGDLPKVKIMEATSSEPLQASHSKDEIIKATLEDPCGQPIQ